VIHIIFFDHAFIITKEKSGCGCTWQTRWIKRWRSSR